LGNQIELYKWLQLSLLLLQRFPIAVLSIMILFSRRISNEENMEMGPSIISRIVLAIALCCNIPNDIPLGYWYFFMRNTVVATKCIFFIANFFDLIVFLYLISLFLWFLFMRFEYVRNQEATMFKAMQATQSVFDVRFD
jgi:hypothetical protein